MMVSAIAAIFFSWRASAMRMSSLILPAATLLLRAPTVSTSMISPQSDDSFNVLKSFSCSTKGATMVES